MGCREIQGEIIKEFAALDTWEDKYRHIIKMGRSLPPFPEDLKTTEHTLMSCQTVIWHRAALDGDRITIHANSDSLQMRGLIALLLRVYSRQTAGDILNTPPDFLSEIGMDTFQSVNHSTGIEAFVEQIRSYARQMSA